MVAEKGQCAYLEIEVRALAVAHVALKAQSETSISHPNATAEGDGRPHTGFPQQLARVALAESLGHIDVALEALRGLHHTGFDLDAPGMERKGNIGGVDTLTGQAFGGLAKAADDVGLIHR